METRFYICPHCGNLVGKIHDSGVPLICCGEKMQALVGGEVEASKEKHIPAVSIEGNIVTVTVGETIHPMSEEHHIAWVYLLTDKGGHRIRFESTAEPVAKVTLTDEKLISVYAYCNLHGLWKKDI